MKPPSKRDKVKSRKKGEPDMDKFLEKIVNFTQKRYMKVLMDGFMGIAAVTIAGSLFNLIKSIPIGAWQTFLSTSGFGALLSIPVSITSDLMAIYVVFSMAYCLAKSFNRNGFAAGIIAFGSFMILTPLTASSVSVDPATGERVVTLVGKRDFLECRRIAGNLPGDHCRITGSTALRFLLRPRLEN